MPALQQLATPSAERAPTPIRAQVAALIAENKLAEAKTLLHGAPASLQRQTWYVVAGLTLALRTNNDRDVSRFVGVLCAANLTNINGLHLAARMLREAGRLEQADAVLARAMALFPESGQAWRDAASVARLRGQPEAMADRLARLVELPGATQDDVYDAVAAAAAVGRHDVARNLSAINKAPPADEDPAALAAAAGTASALGRPELAAMKLQQLAALQPDDPAIAARAALSLLAPKKSRKRRSAFVLARLEALRLRFPDHLGSYTATLDAWREIDGLEQAARLASEWAGQWGGKPDFVISRLRIAEERGAFGEGLAQLQQARAALPKNPILEAALVRLLAALERYEEADAAALSGLSRFPANLGLHREFARVAVRQGDLKLALERWRKAETARPGDKAIAREMRAIEGQLASQGLADTAAAPPDTEDVLDRFESLGGTAFGCEFGMVQQWRKAGSIGLLKWSTYPIETVIGVLENRLADIGSMETTALGTVKISAGNEEYLIKDTKHGFSAHTFVKLKDVPAEKALAQGRRRFKFLAGKMLDDLAAAQRIIVFKVGGDVSEPKLHRLLGALRTYGDHALLCVTKANGIYPAGTLREVSRGLFIGYLGWFMKDNSADAVGIDIEGWRDLCARTEKAWRQ